MKYPNKNKKIKIMKVFIVKVLFVLVVLLRLRYCAIYLAIDYNNTFALNIMSFYNYMINSRPIPNVPLINAIFDYNETPLVYAIRRDKYESVKILLKNGANPNALYGWEGNLGIPLEYCLRHGGKKRFKIADLLLEFGAKYRNETSFLIDLVGHDEPETNDYKYKLFVDWFDTNDFNVFNSNDNVDNYYYLIRSAIFGNSYNELKYIFENYNIDINYKYQQDDIPYVIYAISNHKPKILKLLIEYGANINIIHRGKTLEELIKSDDLASKEEYDRESNEYILVDYTEINNEMLNILNLARSVKLDKY